MKRKLRLTFPNDVGGKPIISSLVRECGVDINILQAQVRAGMQGVMLMELCGSMEAIANGIDLLSREGVAVTELSRRIVWDAEKCMHCGCCTAVCPSGALKLGEDAKLFFDSEACFLCEACLTSCPVNILRLSYD